MRNEPSLATEWRSSKPTTVKLSVPPSISMTNLSAATEVTLPIARRRSSELTLAPGLRATEVLEHELHGVVDAFGGPLGQEVLDHGIEVVRSRAVGRSVAPDHPDARIVSAEARRVGKECVSTCRS